MLLRYQRAILIGFTLLIYSLQGYTNVLAVDQIISEQEGKTVIVPCPVNKDKCGELHSLNWFKGDNRIAAMLLDDSNVTSVAEEFEDRVSVEQNPFRLIIRNLQISDEDIYLCDTTYFIPIETCDNFNGHRVELNVLVPPSEVVILDEKGDRIENGSIIGPMQERQTLKTTCIVKNTRPQPQVGWWRGNKRLTTHSPSYDEKDGLFTATLELSLQLSREDLGHSIECRTESASMRNTIKNHFSVDLQVRPTTVTINGVEHHTVQGSKVVLTCDVHGARPPVNLTWFNASQPMNPEENELMEIRTRAFEKEDGTYHTQSDLIFNASRFENDVKFVCQAENIVLQINRETPMQSLLTLEVLYPPVVKVSPPEITVNTSDTVLLNCEYVANPASLDHVVWYRNGEVVNVNDTERFEGGNSENVALVIRSTEKQDIGNYTCQLSNSIGKGVSEQKIDLDVQYVPIVEVLMIPEGPVKESDESNVTLFCNIIDANPAVLTRVRWYANSTLLKELPDCEETREDLCHIDPSKLLLESIGRGFFYNYSCEGYNAAGWGPRSEDKELLVHYEPGPATLTHFPLIAVKKKSVTFSCNVDDPGYPESNRFRWLRGGRGPLQDIVTKDWTVEPVGLDSRTNYSCYAFNEGGKGIMATVNLEVHAPPFFIKNLPPYTGMLHTSRNANLTCRIECVPRCEISWLKDGVPIEKNDTRYFVKDKYMDASPATGDFESMLSVLHFNMSNWSNNKFDIEGDNANYTCVSTGNAVGPGIKSATYFSIEYAPDNTTVSEEVVYVQEETIPGRVICKSRANPEPTYEWRFNNKTVIRGNALIINTPMMRNDTGRYTCVAFNKHGRSTAEAFIDVQFKPRCEIEREEIEDKDTLICSAFGNPEEADFSWSIKAENETVEWLGSGDHKTFKDKSYYELKEDYAIARTYRCVANNTAGAGTFCEIEVAEQLAWWQRWDKTTLIILVASILILLLAVIIICCIIICICRRRRRQDKYRTDVSMSATHSVLSYQPHMPQVLSANTVLPDTLKVPIISNMLLPTMAGQVKDNTNIMATSIIKQTPTITNTNTSTTTTNTPTTTPIKTPTLTKHLTKTDVKCKTNSSGNESSNNANNTQIHNIINSTVTEMERATATTTITTVANTITMTTMATTPTLSVRGIQIPKSPPRWPLRPGVMVHVSSDTKENLAVNRMTLKPTATLANLTMSTVNDSSVSSSTLNNSGNITQTTLLNDSRQSSTLGRIGKQGIVQYQQQHYDQDMVALQVEANECNKQQKQQEQLIKFSHTLPLRGKRHSTTNVTIFNDANNTVQQAVEKARVTEELNLVSTSTNNNELANLTQAHEAEIVEDIQAAENSNIPSTLAEVTHLHKQLSHLKKLELFFANIFFKRSSKTDTCRDSQRSHVGLLGGKFWKRSETTAATAMKTETPFSTEHRLKGIRSSGSVTYKKCAKTSKTGVNASSIVTMTNTITSTITNTSITINNNNKNDLIPNTVGQTTTIAGLAQQQAPVTTLHPLRQELHPLPVSMTLMSPSLSTNHPPPVDAKNQGTTVNATQISTNKSVTTVIQSIPSTIISSREVKRNPSQRSIRKGILKAPTPPPRPPPPIRGKSMTAVQIQRSSSQSNTSKLETVQTVQEKSSSMADPLTEPGEYENLPFHGLQTAPNKFTTPTTPTNFNNNTNVVRSVPRPKRLNGNISQNTMPATTTTTTAQGTYYDEHETGAQQPQQQYHLQKQQQQQEQQQQQPYNTMPHNRHTQHAATMSGIQTLIPNSMTATMSNNIRNEAGIIVHNSINSNNNNIPLQHQTNAINTTSTTNGTNPQQMAYNPSNCFPKSYTEYYQQQQQQQQQHSQSQSHHQFSQKTNNSGLVLSSSHMINAIEHDVNPYAVVEHQQHHPHQHQQNPTTNPFLAVSNFKKFDTSGDEDLQSESNQTASMKRQGKRKTFVDKLEDKRFYSLKFSGNSNKQKQQNKSLTTAAALNINHSFNGVTGGGFGTGGGVLGSLLFSTNKCKRHHSFAGGSLGDINPKGPARNPLMNFYDPPAYENVNDSVQVHSETVNDMELADPISYSAQTATVLLHPLPYGIAGGSQGPKKKHHQRQHHPKEDLNLIEPERLSIYRSDSGISNSSYECVTPLPSGSQTQGGTPPPTKMPRTPKTPKTPKGHKNQTLAHTAVTAHFNSSHKKPAPRVPPTPLYMNVNDQVPNAMISNLERPSSPTPTMATSAYESASSSQNDNTCNDPISLSSTTSLYSSSGINKPPIHSRCNRHQQPPEITTPEEFEQYQLGHHAHAHSSSSLSVASSISASGSNAGAGGRVKCKKQQQRLNSQAVVLNHLELNKCKPLANNPFLATNRAATAATTCRKKLHRRQTISDPYAHIKHISESQRQSNNTNNNSNRSSNNNNEAHNYCFKSANTFRATTATTISTQSSAYSSYQSQQQHQQKQQQTNLQQCSEAKQPSSSTLSQHTTSATAAACHQQQMLMFYELQNVKNNSRDTSDNMVRPYNEVVLHADDAEYKTIATANAMDYKNESDQLFKEPHMSLSCHVANNDDDGDNDREEQKNISKLVRNLSNKTITTAAAVEKDATFCTLGYIKRPVKLPLRKYHSFHFQPTQTVTGQQLCKLQELEIEQQQHQQQLNEQNYVKSSHPYAQQGPLIYRPYHIDANTTFKPIQPSEESEDSIDYVEEYVGTVEKFLRDEEKFMDSGDFTNLTQCLKKQQAFLKADNTPLEEEGCSVDCKELLTAQCDSESSSLYEDLKFKAKSITPKLKEIPSCPESSIAIKDIIPVQETNKAGHFMHSPRTLSLPKTILEIESMESEQDFTRTLKKRETLKQGWNEIESNQNTISILSNPNTPKNTTSAKLIKESPVNKYAVNRIQNSPKISPLKQIMHYSQEKVNRTSKSRDSENNFITSQNLSKNSENFFSTKEQSAILKTSITCMGNNSNADFNENLLKEEASKNQNKPSTCVTVSRGPSRKFLDFSEDTVLDEQDLAKVFKPYEQQKSQDFKNIKPISTALNPAASLEALEMLTKSNPKLWTSNHAGSRHNLHQLELFNSLQKQHKTQTKEEEEEDLGYSYCEDENDEDGEEEEWKVEKRKLQTPQSPSVTVMLAHNDQMDSKVKYVLTQNHGEVHI